MRMMMMMFLCKMKIFFSFSLQNTDKNNNQQMMKSQHIFFRSFVRFHYLFWSLFFFVFRIRMSDAKDIIIIRDFFFCFSLISFNSHVIFTSFSWFDFQKWFYLLLFAFCLFVYQKNKHFFVVVFFKSISFLMRNFSTKPKSFRKFTDKIFSILMFSRNFF